MKTLEQLAREAGGERDSLDNLGDGWLFTPDDLARFRAACRAEALEEAAQWQPIETAPNDGTEFLAYRRGKVATAYRVPRDDCEMWVFGGSSAAVEHFPSIKPTHWMPLPQPPAIRETK